MKNKVLKFEDFVKESENNDNFYYNDSVDPIQFLDSNEIVEDDLGREYRTETVSLNNAKEAVRIAREQIIKMIELDFDTAGQLGGELPEAQRIINRIKEL